MCRLALNRHDTAATRPAGPRRDAVGRVWTRCARYGKFVEHRAWRRPSGHGGLMSARAFVSCAYTSQMESEKIDNRTVFSLSPPQLTSSQSKRLSQVALVLLDAEQDRRGRPPEPQQELLLLARVRLPLVLARESALRPNVAASTSCTASSLPRGSSLWPPRPCPIKSVCAVGGLSIGIVVCRKIKPARCGPDHPPCSFDVICHAKGPQASVKGAAQRRDNAQNESCARSRRARARTGTRQNIIITYHATACWCIAQG